MSDSDIGQEVPDLPTPPTSPPKSSPSEDNMVEILRNSSENHFELSHSEDRANGLINGNDCAAMRNLMEDDAGDVDPSDRVYSMQLEDDASKKDLEEQYLEELLETHLQMTLTGIDDSLEEPEVRQSEEADSLRNQLRSQLQEYTHESFDKTLADFEPQIMDETKTDDTTQEVAEAIEVMEDSLQDRLDEVPVEDWPRLRDMFADFWPRDILAYNALDNHLRIKTRNPAAASRVLCLNGDWSDGTFILQDSIAVCVYTLEDSCCRLEQALRLFDWSIGPQIHPYDEKHKAVVDRVREDLGLTMVYNYETIFYWMPKEQAAEFDLTAPDDVYVAPLTPEHADIANPVWSRKFDGSDLYMRDAIRNNPSRGVFGKDKGDLRSWIMSHNNGVLLALHTHPDHRRKGYGSLILKAISRAKADENSDTVASVLPSNVASVTLFNKLGFKPLEPKWWTKTRPF